MTYLRKWEDTYLSDLAGLPSEEMRTKVRSMTTMLAGNPYLEPSVPVEPTVRAIDVQGRLVLLYKICEDESALLFLHVSQYGPYEEYPRDAREVLEELRVEG